MRSVAHPLRVAVTALVATAVLSAVLPAPIAAQDMLPVWSPDVLVMNEYDKVSKGQDRQLVAAIEALMRLVRR